MAPETFPTITMDLVVDKATAKEALKALLHAIFFHRLFGTIKPQTVEVLDVTLPAVNDPEVEKIVEEKVAILLRNVRGVDNVKRGQVILIFSEKRQKRGWIYTEEQVVPWEQWMINVEVRQPKSDAERISIHSKLSTTLTNALMLILTHTSSEKGRAAVPIISSAVGVSPFPYKLLVKAGGVEVNA